MAIIKKPFDPIEVKSIKLLFYGQPGIRKTSFAFTANNCVLLDCDRGVRRVAPAYRGEYIEVNSWADIASIVTDPDVLKFDTIIIDTAGKALDFLATQIMVENSKLNYQGNLTLQGYGVMKNRFRLFLSQIEQMNKNLIFVSHDKEGKDGEQVVIRPDITGASMSILIREMDMVGYMESKNNLCSLSFNPTDRYYGKNSCGLAPIANLNGHTAQQIFDLYNTQQDSVNELAKDYEALLAIITEKMQGVTDEATAESVSGEVGTLQVIWDSKLQSRVLFSNRLKELGLKYNSTTKSYEKIPAIPVAAE